MYDLIGDIHGHAHSLTTLLEKMDYEKVNGVWQHPEHIAIFVGDYIDRGPAIRETLVIVRKMVETGKAIALMGNHEYNALAYAIKHDGNFLRPHNTKNNQQHQATLDQFTKYGEEWQSYLEWFYSLPLFLDQEGIRVVHACWDEKQISWLKQFGHYTMSEELLIASHQKNSKAYTVINDILKGKEFSIPEEYAWNDKDGHSRTENRYKWWVDPNHASYGDFLFNCPQPLKDQMIEMDINAIIYPKEAPPVFFGHYWLEDPTPVIQSGNVICLDYSVAKGGYLVGYRWDGEKELKMENFVYVKE